MRRVEFYAFQTNTMDFSKFIEAVRTDGRMIQMGPWERVSRENLSQPPQRRRVIAEWSELNNAAHAAFRAIPSTDIELISDSGAVL